MVTAISLGVVALGAFLPWVSLFGITKLGVQGDGIITLILALVGAGLLIVSVLARRRRAAGRGPMIAVLVLAVLATLVALIDMNGVAAIGLYLTLFGGVAWIVGAAWSLANRGGPPSTATP